MTPIAVFEISAAYIEVLDFAMSNSLIIVDRCNSYSSVWGFRTLKQKLIEFVCLLPSYFTGYL